MANLIGAKDALNTGRDKLNAAIIDAENARTTSLTAKSTADQALGTSTTTQMQLDNIILENGQSDAEVVQARGDFPLLYKRLDDYSQYRTGITIEYFGARAIEDVPGFDSRSAIQIAIDSVVPELYVPHGKTYEVTLDGQTYEGKGTGIALKLRDNLRIYGGGTIRIKDGQGGNFSIVANVTDSIKNCRIEGITIDGNRDNTNGSNRANMILFGAENCHFQKVTSINSKYVGLMMRGTGGKRNSIKDCYVKDCNYIGIQAQNNEGMQIIGNQVYNVGDNGIDIEGNDSTGGLNNLGFGKQVVVQGNVINGANSGVFLESTGQMIVTGNSVYNTNIAIFINRINSGSYKNIVSNNILINEDGVGETKASNEGVRFNNNVGRSLVTNNFIEGFKYGVRAGSTVSNIVVKDNYFSKILKFLVHIRKETNALIKSSITENFYEQAQVDGFPKTTSPIAEPSYKQDRAFNVSVSPAKLLESNANLRDTYYRTTGSTNNSRSGWGGAYAIYINNETKVYVPNGTIVTGEYLKINGVFYYAHSNTSGEITIRDITDQAAGDYTQTVNGSYTVYVYSTSEYNALLVD